MDEQAAPALSELDQISKLGVIEQTQLLLARLMEGGQEDDDTCLTLDRLTKLLNEDAAASAKAKSICEVLDDVCVDTILGYLDMRQAAAVRGHAILTASAYLKAAGDKGSRALQMFFFDRVKRGTYDDYIVAFCVAAAVFPVAPDATTEMFLSEGFLPSLDPLMRRKWKSRKVETACLEMLNAASMHPECREAIRKYCTDWLEEVVDQNPEELSKAIHAADPDVQVTPGSIAMRRHSQAVQHLAAVILAKLRAVPSATQQATREGGNRIQPAVTSIEELSEKFTTFLLSDPESSRQHSIEGLAYATIQPTVKEQVARNSELLKTLVKVLGDAPARSPLTYGALSIFVNLTRFQPTQSEEEKKMNQLKAYANAAGKLPPPNPLNDSDRVTDRCKRVFEAGVVPVLVTHSRHGSSASLSLIASIIFSLSVNPSLRGQLAQQGAVGLLIMAWSTLSETDTQSKRMAAQALARILISTDPSLVFGGTRARPQNAAIRPLASILQPDPDAETRDLLPAFEAMMALTNLASTDDDTRATIIRLAFTEIEEHIFSSKFMVCRAATELICNLVQCVEGIALYADGTSQASNRLHLLLGLTAVEDEATRRAAGGALASLVAYEEVVRETVKRTTGVENLLSLCSADDEELRHRGAFIVCTMIEHEGEPGTRAREVIRQLGGVQHVKACAQKSRSPEVVELAAGALKVLLQKD
ncbi:putative actin cytoskeleton organization protein [Nemania sp. NC0429]|nr:putative actin cytoskeleton organization protein [Nemania sp. NC0429]